MAVATNLLAPSVSDIETDTTGWATGANTTLALGGRGYTGSASLQLTATAAGTASATTITRVPVTAGQVYTAYAYAALVAAAAGRAVNVFIGWYANASGGTALSYSTSPSSTLANSTAFNTPPPVLIATAPAGAAYAVLGVNVTGLAAGGQALVDAAALGPPALAAGNLLDYTSQSVEQDATGWAAWYAVTLARSSAASVEGWWSLQLTSTLAGNCQAALNTAVSVTAGKEYLASASARPGTAALSVLIDIRWQDAADNPISTTTTTWTALPSATWTRVCVAGTAPPGAAKARIVLRPQATATAQVWLFDQIGLQLAANEPGNLLDYPRYSTEVSAAGWTAAGGTAARSLAQAAEGLASLALTCAGTGEAVLTLAAPVPVIPGQAYQFRPMVRPPAAGAAYTVRLAWLDAAGQILRQTSAAYSAGAATAWTPSTTVDLAPPRAVTLRPSLVRSGAVPGEVWYLDKVLIAPGGLAARVEPTGAGYGARIYLQGLTTGGRTRWGLWRTSPDGTQTPVRGYNGDLTGETATGDVAVAEDYEAPLGTAVSYYAKAWTGAAGTDWTTYTSDQITLAHPDELGVVLKDPSLPARSLVAMVATVPNWQRSARQGVHAVRGRARPVVLTDVRAARTGTLTVTTATDAQRQALWWLLESGHTLLAQWPASWGIGDLYLQVGDAEENRLSDYAPQPDREFVLAVTEVDRPVGALVGSAGRTWQSVLDTNTTWADVLARSRTWLDVLTGVQGS
ncbi:hypothetical protein [Kitasatospora sp. MBT66]|uniref:hypothetical protein n=1 Tax=Kitasatospora sp. MBT66 TaxID=1444769 RepID=UPI0005BB38F2|nr:hypothetical protein [Kitasatospora sp. MBT66]